MKRLFTLITLLFSAAFVANAAYVRKVHHVHRKKHHVAAFESSSVSSFNTSTNTDSVSADNVLSFAHTLLGIPYRPASSSPLYGFDCSGFVSYVFKNFNFNVPRSSDEFIHVGEKVDLADARPGDILLFKGTKTHHPHSVGHIAIVYSNDGDGLKFIHSTSGKEYCVTITAMDDNYKRRFVQVVRLLKQNDSEVLASR